MNPFARLVAIGLVIGCCAVIGAEPARLPADQLARAIKNDSISIPTPGELSPRSKNRGSRIGPANIAPRCR